MTAREKLLNRFNLGYHICVGLDTDLDKIPKYLLEFEDPIFEFNKRIIEKTSGIAAAYKMNFAFYEKYGAAGLNSLEKTLKIIPKNIPSIADAKRGDIGNTAKYYAQAVFENMNFDSVTLNPYMGYDSIAPFAEYRDKLLFILVLTSNGSSSDFEKLIMRDNNYLFRHVLQKVNSWNTNKNLGVVFGATNPDELAENIGGFGDLIILLPGVGAQGGSLKNIAELFALSENNNFLVNSSRAVIYASSGNDFADKAFEQVDAYNQTVSRQRR